MDDRNERSISENMSNRLTSSNLPVLIDQTNILNVSKPPAQTTSPATSKATQENWTGVGDVYVRKLRYLNEKSTLIDSNDFHVDIHRKRSKARTVPSNELETINCPFEANSNPVTVDECSENVTKQNPLVVFHNLI